MEHPSGSNTPETTWSYDLGQAIRQRDWSRLGLLVLTEACPPVLKLAAVVGGVTLVAWIIVFVQQHVSKEDLKFLVVTVPISLAVLVFGLWASFFLAIAAIAFWQMTIIFVLIGGFIGGGLGALIGAALSGGLGLILHKMSDRI